MKKSINIDRLKNLSAAILAAFLIFPLFTTSASAQDSTLMNWDLSRLRGNWQFHTFDDKWTLNFESDHNLVFDRDDAQYVWTPGALRIRVDKDEEVYPYKITNDELALTLPDGSTRTYKKTDAGDAEQSVHARFTTLPDSSKFAWQVTFDGKGVFALHDSIGNDRGLYRVEGNMVILTFEDNSVDEAQVRFRDEDNKVSGILLDDRLYESKQHITSNQQQSSSPTSTYIPPPSYDPTGPVLYLPSLPPPPVVIVNNPPAVTQQAPPPAKRDDGEKARPAVRTTGSKRPGNK